MPPAESKQSLRGSLLRGKRGNAVYGFGLGFAGFQIDSLSFELEDLAAVGECEVVVEQGGGAQGPDFNAAVAFIDRLVLRGKKSLARGA